MNLKLAIRSFRKTPFVTLATVISLALGIGANAAVFSIFHQVLLRDLPVSQPDRLVNLSSPGPTQGHMHHGDLGECQCVFSYPMFKDLEREQNVFAGIAAHIPFGSNLTYSGQSESVNTLFVSGSYFAVLGFAAGAGSTVQSCR